MNIKDVADAVIEGRIRITRHAYKEALEDHLSFDEILRSIRFGEIIEDYPSDKPYPSCLILGRLPFGIPIHSVWAYNSVHAIAILVTVYRPNPVLWINWKERVRK